MLVALAPRLRDGQRPGVDVLLAQRAGHLRTHSGELALPGGAAEPARELAQVNRAATMLESESAIEQTKSLAIKILHRYTMAGELQRAALLRHGGLGACLECLASAPAAATRAFWGGMRVTAVDTRGTTTCTRPKLLFFTHIGAAVGTRTRTRALLHTGALAEVLHGAHCVLEVEDAQTELTPTRLASKLLAATGAHKPNAYDFGGGLVVEYDYYAGV